MKMNSRKKIILLLMVIFVILFVIHTSLFIVLISPKEHSANTLENKLNDIKNELHTVEQALEHNLSQLAQWQLGNAYELHDPLYEGAKSFMENDTSKQANDTINKAKSQGLRCALVDIRIIYKRTRRSYELIAFDTIDEGMIYFEPDTDYQVIPKINENYVKCVYNETGKNPYYSKFDDTIVDILVIW